MTEACKICGEWFTKKKNNQRYCCENCKREAARRIARKRYYDVLKPQSKVVKKSSTPSITIDDMVAIMLKLSQERGRAVQYGEVQRELMTGKLKVKDGVVV